MPDEAQIIPSTLHAVLYLAIIYLTLLSAFSHYVLIHCGARSRLVAKVEQSNINLRRQWSSWVALFRRQMSYLLGAIHCRLEFEHWQPLMLGYASSL